MAWDRLAKTPEIQLLLVHVIFLVISFADAHSHVCGHKGDDVEHFDVTLPVTNVPPALTTYTCLTQQIPMDIKALSSTEEFYAIAFEPLIDNSDVMHHMIMFGCPRYVPDTDRLLSPHYCGASDNRCRSFLVQWSMGIKGVMCSPPNTGIKLGVKGLEYLALQMHWNNAKRRNGTTDRSGIRVYYTRKPQRYELGNIQVGQNDLEIPARQSHYAQTGSCSSDCTKQWLKQPIYLTRAHIHMHYLGAGGKLELVRGSKIISVVNDETYTYNRPPAHTFQRPVRVLPGDELRLTCYFNSRDGVRRRNQTVYWGEGSDGEMCYAFITYYPKVQDFDQCIQFDKYDICSATGFASFGECVFQGFVKTFQSGMSKEIQKNCVQNSNRRPSKSTNRNPTNVELRRRQVTKSDGSHLCSEKCEIAIREVTEHPCMQGRLGHYARRVYLPKVREWATVRTLLDQWRTQCVH